MTEQAQKPSGLALMRAPFPANQISKLPKPTKAQTDAVKNDFKAGTRCAICGTWHHPQVVHLDYVGHAALTDRLLECDPAWNWQPVALDGAGLPLLDNRGGLWIKLTVCGVTRLGYGNADGKSGGDAIKELIGDALRNAAMRFGAALDLWHKGDLHVEDAPDVVATEQPKESSKKEATPQEIADGLIAAIQKRAALTELLELEQSEGRAAKAWDWLATNHKDQAGRVRAAFDQRKAQLSGAVQ